MTHQVDRFFTSFRPTTDRRYRPIRLRRKADMLECHQHTGFDASPHHIETKALTFKRRGGRQGRAAYVRPPSLFERLLQLYTVKFPVTEE